MAGKHRKDKDPYRRAASASPLTPRVTRALSALGGSLARLQGPFPILIAGLSLAAIAVWLLRVPSLAQAGWPWLVLLIGMFLAADAVTTALPALPDRRIVAPAHPPPLRAPRRRAVVALFAAAALLSAGIVVKLWPNYQVWNGTLSAWALALALFLLGCSGLGLLGGGSPRLVAPGTIHADRRVSRALELVAILTILSIALFLRTYRLDSIPPGITHDESDASLGALSILDGDLPSPFGTGWYDTPSAFMYYMALVYRVAGATWLGLKLVSLIPALLTLPAVYLLAREAFGSPTALSAMAILAISRWHITMSRWAWNGLAPALVLTLALYFLLRALRLRRALDYAMSGLLSGLAAYTYLSARLAALVVALYVVYWLVSEPAGLRFGIRHRWKGILVLVAGFVIAVAPLAVTYIRNPAIWSHRTAEVSVLRDIRERQSLQPLLLNVGDVLKFFHQRGDVNGRNNLPGEPMLDPFTGFLFAVGIAISVFRWRDHRHIMLLLWLSVASSASFLSVHSESPQAYRTILAIPAVCLISAVALVQIGKACQPVLHTRFRGPRKGLWSNMSMAGLSVVMLMAAGMWEARVYFGPQARSDGVLRMFPLGRTGVAREVVEGLRGGKTVYVWQGYRDNSQLRFLVYGTYQSTSRPSTLENPPYRFIDPARDLPLQPDGRDAVILFDPVPVVGDYIQDIYPDAEVDLPRRPEDTPLYLRVQIPDSQLQGLAGLIQTVRRLDGTTASSVVSEIGAPASTDLTGVEWDGLLRVVAAGEYSIVGHGGLQAFLEGQRLDGPAYLLPGSYRLHLQWDVATAAGAPTLTWTPPSGTPGEVPSAALFHGRAAPRGLLAEYFWNTEWHGEPGLRQLIPFLDLSWGLTPAPAPEGTFSVRFTGFLRVQEGGQYRFRVQADDGARLVIDGQTAGESLVPRTGNTFEAALGLGAGDHPLEIDYVQWGGSSGLRILWAREGEPWSLIPPSALIPPNE